MNRLSQFVLWSSCAVLMTACGRQPAQPRRGDKTREVVAEATQRMKPEIKRSAKELGAVADWAADETLAAIEGFFEGWFRPSIQSINVNSASTRELENLPGVTSSDAHRIISGRPYRDKRELVRKGVISEAVYARIVDRVAIK